MSRRPSKPAAEPRRRSGAPPADSPLVFNVSTLLGEMIGALRRYHLADAPFTFAGQSVCLTGSLELLRTDASILVRASLHLTLTEPCAACLAPVHVPLRLDLEEEFWPDFDPRTLARVQVPAGREGFPIVAGHLDLHDAVRQYVEMARPMRPQCASACPGLGAASRGDLPPVDSRWAPLRQLRDGP